MIVFDLDDTLYKEYDYQKSGFRAVAKELEKKGFISEEEAFSILMTGCSGGKGIDRLIEKLDSEYPGHGVTVAKILEIYRYHEPDIRLDESTGEVLRKLKEAGKNMGLITDGRSRTQRLKIKALGLDRFFEEKNILISEEIGADKTDPLMFKTMMERNPDELSYWYVGDNPAKDFYHANKLGWHTAILLDIEAQNVHPQNLDVPKDYTAVFQFTTLQQLLPMTNVRHDEKAEMKNGVVPNDTTPNKKS